MVENLFFLLVSQYKQNSLSLDVGFVQASYLTRTSQCACNHFVYLPDGNKESTYSKDTITVETARAHIDNAVSRPLPLIQCKLLNEKIDILQHLPEMCLFCIVFL